jgi:hypothetical protein
MNDIAHHPVAEWHRILETRDIAALGPLLHEDAVFLSPVVHTPQRGKQRVMGYLGAAAEVLGNPSFRYVREIIGPCDAMLEFETEIDGISVNGIDLLQWDEAGRIVEFKVMVRPLKAIQVVQARMAERLQAGSAAAASAGER